VASGVVSTQADSGQPLATQPLATQPLATQPLATQPLATQRFATVAEAVDVLFPRRGQIAVVVGTHDRRGALGFTHNQGSEDV